MFDGSLPEIGDLAALSDAELITASAGWGRVESAAAARKLAAMAEVFRRRTGLDDALDRNLWFVDPETSVVSELAAAHNITDSLALFQTHRAVALRDRLPKVAALFARGLLSDLLVRAVVCRTTLITDPDTLAAVDTALAEQLLSWGPTSAKKTKAAIDAIVETHDPAALRCTTTADRDRDIEFGDTADDAGYMTLWARMYAPDGVAFEQRVEAMAHTVCPDDPRTMRERRNDAFAAVATGNPLRCECDNPHCPTATADRPTPNVIIHLITTHDALDDARNEGAAEEPAQAEHDAREEKPTASAPEDNPTADGYAAEGQPVDDHTNPHTTSDASEEPPADPQPAPKPTPAPAFVIGGGVLSPVVLPAFLDRAKIRQLRHPGDTPPEPHYRPSIALQDFVRCRDLTCRFPGCDKPATLCDIDHTVPYPTGPTSASNLKCLCRKHHLLKTFWTGQTGWRDQQLPDGTVIWTSPSGQTHITHPGSALLFPTLCTPTAAARKGKTADAAKNRGLMMPKRRRTRAQDRRYRIDAERRLNDDFVAERTKPPPF
ncbi:HNH endonuclease signature motif containing protein [Mycolicibacterium litorale]|uniref:HNH endonuclease n=2 Tax=Mycolicibacterium litorale TaxID=758802 RepID=A0AAD1IM29_9MYCO|nr:HNH endonuclease signature motif containing protein [Mycolicibacterium litorale]BBY17979.1 HNH endonuclease [Mycolicibacterium litorale]